ncbi:hypothetical protein OIU85_022170 [Salix viminalis]|uniref:Uncharacterized protein n=1 Tax=Salix viminalis TaxID=40686 RepID=A0A9Q0U678_SALVM|nr:hypothetical protein OIU85_022170 [Salix viminalis]
MASTNPIKVVEVCHITPSTQSPESAIEISHPLTFFDMFFLNSHHSELNFFYMLPELTRSVFRSVILPKLKHSLSLTLLHFLPVAGNLTWPPHAAKPIISYTPNDGVSLTVAESNNIADFDCLTSNEMHDAFISHPYITRLSAISDTKVSILSLQITLFPNKGFSIGYSTSHAAVDGKSVTMFMKAWAHICKHDTSLPPAEFRPSYDRTAVHDPEDIGPEYLKRWSGMNQLVGLDARTLKPILSPEVPPSSVRATFEFSHADIRRLRVRVLSQYGKERKPIHLSSFVLSYAYTLVCIAKARGLNKDDKIIFRFPGDCRARLDPPLPTNYFGNCVMHQVGDLDVEALVGDDHGIAYVAQKLAQMVKQLGKGALEGAKEKLAKNTDTSPRTLPIGLTGSPGFDLYGVDFGWGRPEKVEFTMLDRSESISMIDSKDGNGGLEIGLVLKKHHMEIFQTLFVEGLCNDSGYSK